MKYRYPFSTETVDVEFYDGTWASVAKIGAMLDAELIGLHWVNQAPMTLYLLNGNKALTVMADRYVLLAGDAEVHTYQRDVFHDAGLYKVEG